MTAMIALFVGLYAIAIQDRDSGVQGAAVINSCIPVCAAYGIYFYTKFISKTMMTWERPLHICVGFAISSIITGIWSLIVTSWVIVSILVLITSAGMLYICYKNLIQTEALIT